MLGAECSLSVYYTDLHVQRYLMSYKIIDQMDAEFGPLYQFFLLVSGYPLTSIDIESALCPSALGHWQKTKHVSSWENVISNLKFYILSNSGRDRLNCFGALGKKRIGNCWGGGCLFPHGSWLQQGKKPLPLLLLLLLQPRSDPVITHSLASYSE